MAQQMNNVPIWERIMVSEWLKKVLLKIEAKKMMVKWVAEYQIMWDETALRLRMNDTTPVSKEFKERGHICLTNLKYLNNLIFNT